MWEWDIIRAKIESLPTGPSGDVYLEDVIALFPTSRNTARDIVVPFKVISLGSRFRYVNGCRVFVKIGPNLIAQWDEEKQLDEWIGQPVLIFSECDEMYDDVVLVRSDHPAPTDNTALVEAQRERDEELRSANYWRKRAMTAEAALSQPAAPQPTPEVEALVDRLLFEADAMKKAVSGDVVDGTFHAFNWSDKPHRVVYDAVKLLREAAAALARGSVAEKGER